MKNPFKFDGFLKDQQGATSVEYALIAVLIAFLLVSSLTSVGTAIKDIFQTLINAI